MNRAFKAGASVPLITEVIDVFRSTSIAALVAASLLVPITGAHAGTVSGRITNAQPGMKVLLVANDGSALSAKVKPNGKFTLKGSKKVMRKAFPKKGPGPTLHLLRNDIYAGPVLLGVKSPKKGYARLLGQGPKQVNLGTLTVKKQGFVKVTKRVSAKALDTKRTVRLRNKVPLGAGTQGATGRLARTAGVPRYAASVLPPSQTGPGADADADGVPNLADVDMNGDQILDAAQLAQVEQTLGGEQLAGSQVLENRPFKAANVIKILDTSRTVSVNSNANADVTWEELTTYLNEQLSIETGVESNGLRQLFCPETSAEAPCDLVRRVSAVEVNCQLLDYCGLTSQAVIRAAGALDGQLLRSILLPNGAFPLTDQSNGYERNFSMYFAPKVTNQANLLLVGDAYEFVLKEGDTELGRQATVLTSSVATAPEFVSVAGQPYTLPRDDRNPITLTPEQAAALTVAFYRPQRLNSQDMTGPAPELLDRGGLEYGFTVRDISNPGGEGYWCRAEQVTSTSPDLVALEPGPGPGGIKVARLFDTNMSPANGGVLSYQVDLNGCLTNPSGGPTSPPPAGATLAVEIESFDSDSNRTRSSVYVKLP